MISTALHFNQKGDNCRFRKVLQQIVAEEPRLELPDLGSSRHTYVRNVAGFTNSWAGSQFPLSSSP